MTIYKKLLEDTSQQNKEINLEVNVTSNNK